MREACRNHPELIVECQNDIMVPSYETTNKLRSLVFESIYLLGCMKDLTISDAPR